MISLEDLVNFRTKLAFQKDTAVPGTPEGGTPSAGHCAVVSYLFAQHFPGSRMVSDVFEGNSHWFNEIDGWYIDLTSDQFGLCEIIAFRSPGENSLGLKERNVSELNEETLARAKLLAERSGLSNT